MSRVLTRVNDPPDAPSADRNESHSPALAMASPAVATPERTYMSPGRITAGKPREGDGLLEPLLGTDTRLFDGVEQQVQRVSGEPCERRVERQTHPFQSRSAPIVRQAVF